MIHDHRDDEDGEDGPDECCCCACFENSISQFCSDGDTEIPMTLMAASLRMTGSKAFRNSMGLWSLKERLRFQVSGYVTVEIQKPGQAYPMILHRVLSGHGCNVEGPPG